jgi:hypothetical protein
MYGLDHADTLLATAAKIFGLAAPLLTGRGPQMTLPASRNMPMHPGTQPPIATPAPQPAPAQKPSSFNLPETGREDVSPAPKPETQPAAQETPARPIKRVRW